MIETLSHYGKGWGTRQGASTTQGGIELWFNDSTNSYGTVKDQYGDYMDTDTQVGWESRQVKLDQFANGSRRITTVEPRTLTSNNAYWDIRFYNISLTTADGTVIPIYNGQSSVSMTPYYSSGMTGVGDGVTREHNLGVYPTLDTTYYHADHLGTSRIFTSSTGYPIWQGTFMPFGEEVNPQIGMNHYKFTGDEHDTEDNTEHTPFRQLSSVQGRWLSPDPYLGSMDLTNPQSLNRYAYVMNQPLAGTDPTGLDWDLGPLGCDDDGDVPDPCNGPILGPIFVPIIVPDGGGDGGHSKGGSSGTPEPNVNPSGAPLLSGETLGLPTGMSIQQRGLLAALGVSLPPDCEFGSCTPDLGIGFAENGPPGHSPFINWAYLRAVASSFVSGFSFKSARIPGETISHCVNRVQQGTIGQAGQTVLNSVTGASLIAKGISMPLGSAVATNSYVITTDQTLTIYTRALSLMDMAAGTAVRFGASSSLMQLTTAAATKLSPIAGTAFAIGGAVEGGYFLACR